MTKSLSTMNEDIICQFLFGKRSTDYIHRLNLQFSVYFVIISCLNFLKIRNFNLYVIISKILCQKLVKIKTDKSRLTFCVVWYYTSTVLADSDLTPLRKCLGDAYRMQNQRHFEPYAK